MKFTKHIIASAVALGLAAPMAAMATNGYFSHGYGTKNKGLGGGGVALPQDAMAAATNPAGMVFVGERMDLGLAIFSPNDRGYEAVGGSLGVGLDLEEGKYNSDDDVFFIPHFARNWALDQNSTIGLTVYGNGGMNTFYKANMYQFSGGTYFAGNAGVNLEQLFINTSYSKKIDAKSSWGASLILAHQRFKADGLGAFGASGFSNDPAHLTNNGVDTSNGFGIKLGWQGEVSPGLTLAASYQSEMDMSEFDDYAGLFAEKGDFDIPATWTIGLAYDAPSAGTFTFDVQNIAYSDIAAIANPLIPNLVSGPGNLGTGNGAGFGWEDITVYKLGYQWTANNMTWRVGYNKGDNPIPDSEVLFNILAPGVTEDHYTFGFTMPTGTDSEFNFAAMYAPEVTIKGPNPLAATPQTIELYMSQWELEASWGWKF
jgi:long-chain fatty acid transport protein